MLGHLRHIVRSRTVEDIFDRSVAALREIGLTRVYFQGPIGSDRSLTRNTASFGFPETWQKSYELNWHVLEAIGADIHHDDAGTVGDQRATQGRPDPGRRFQNWRAAILAPPAIIGVALRE